MFFQSNSRVPTYVPVQISKLLLVIGEFRNFHLCKFLKISNFTLRDISFLKNIVICSCWRARTCQNTDRFPFFQCTGAVRATVCGNYLKLLTVLSLFRRISFTLPLVFPVVITLVDRF